MIFGRVRDRDEFVGSYKNSILINNEPIKFYKNFKNLGLALDEDLRFTQHVNKIIQRGYINLKLIFQHRHFLSREIKSMLCESLVLSQVNYCDTIYGPSKLGL